jgi:hypothetical protein
MTLFAFSPNPSRPNKLVAGFFQAFLLDSSACLLGVHSYCSGVPRDCADTLNSTLPSGVSFSSVAMATIASLSSSWGGMGVYSHLLLLVHPKGHSSSGTAYLVGCSEFGPTETRALKSRILGASCAIDMNLVGPALGRRNTLPILMMSRGVCCPRSQWDWHMIALPFGTIACGDELTDSCRS